MNLKPEITVLSVLIVKRKDVKIASSTVRVQDRGREGTRTFVRSENTTQQHVSPQESREGRVRTTRGVRPSFAEIPALGPRMLSPDLARGIEMVSWAYVPAANMMVSPAEAVEMAVSACGFGRRRLRVGTYRKGKAT